MGDEVTNLSIASSETGGTIIGCSIETVQGVPSSSVFVQAAFSEICPPVHEEDEAEFHLLRMNGLLIADTQGNVRAQMQWVVER
jgi:hypothetical protein